MSLDHQSPSCSPFHVALVTTSAHILLLSQMLPIISNIDAMWCWLSCLITTFSLVYCQQFLDIPLLHVSVVVMSYFSSTVSHVCSLSYFSGTVSHVCSQSYFSCTVSHFSSPSYFSLYCQSFQFMVLLLVYCQ